MSWVIAGLIAPFLWAITNIFDQITVRKYFAGQSLLIMVMSSSFSLCAFIALSLYDPNNLDTNLDIKLIFIATSFINCLGFIAYFKALEIDEASNAVPIFQLQPILILILGYFLLSETVTMQQAIGIGLIVFSAIGLMADFKSKKFNWKTLYLMSACCIVLSSTTIIDRYLLENTNWSTALTWKSLGYFLFGSSVAVFSKKMRKAAFDKFLHPIKQGVFIIFLVELIAIAANGFFILSLDLTPAAALTQTLAGFQAVFVLIMGYIAYRIAPQYFKEFKAGVHLGWHIVCLIVIFIGLYLIY